jgi:CheY-like chemotaxis protein
MLKEAQNAARHCTEIIQKIKTVSSPSSLGKSIIQVSGILEEANKLFETVMPSSIAREIRINKDLWPVYGNTSEILSIIINMATNARDAMTATGGKFSIVGSNVDLRNEKLRPGLAEGHYVYLKFQDTGTGIAPKNIPHIFEPFFTTKKKEGGSGLGLSMVLNIITNHGGWIDVSSEVGKGTTFVIYLPARPGEHQTEKAKQEDEVLPHGSGLVLFADDEAHLRNIGKIFLERLGYEVLLASDGEEALKIFEERKKDIRAVVLDMTMPKLTGLQTLKKILAINPKARVLIATGFTEEGTADDLIRAGATGYLPKPYTIAPFAQALKKVFHA